MHETSKGAVDPLTEAVLGRLPHAGPMLFLDRIVRVADPLIETETTFRDDFVMSRDGVISPLVCVELFAQSAAALMAHRSAQANAPKVSGALLGTRRIDCQVASFSVGQTVRTQVVEIFGAGALAQFDCVLTLDGTKVAEGSINVAAGDIG